MKLILIPLAALFTCVSFCQQAPVDQAVGKLETVAAFNGPMPTGVTVSHSHRIFVNFPRWGDEVPFTVAEIAIQSKDGSDRDDRA